jgi:hypothetical protein
MRDTGANTEDVSEPLRLLQHLLKAQIKFYESG